MTDTNQPDTPSRPAGKVSPPIPLNLTIDQTTVTKFLDLFRETLEATLAQALVKPQATLDAKPTPVSAETMPSPKSTGIDLKAADRIKAADLRVALLLGKIPEDAGLLIDTKTFARLLDISSRTLARLQAEEAIPAPVQLGNLKKWRLGEILEWIEADCPPLRVWVHKRQDASKRKGK